MKKTLIIATALVMAAGSLYAKDLNEARIYINPGHGGWGPNDRPMATIPYPNLAETGRPDTCGFYESNTDLWKGLEAGAALERMGVKKENIMFSRVKNGPFPYVKGADNEFAFNRDLAEICEEVDANNMDFFLSIHSNAATEGTSTNYPLFLYRGKDGKNDYAPGSYDRAEKVWPYLKSNELDPMTAYATSMNIRGDIDFYGSSSDREGSNGVTYTGYLGVLKHGCPGFLSEGYFHTYQPARHRALNPDYCFQEGIRYARGVAAYFGSKGENVGYIMGYVKDLHEKIENKLFTYAIGSDDQWMPLNGAVVELMKDGTKVAEYTVDNNYNGIFMFRNLAPGNYTLNYKVEGYKEAGEEYKAPVAVKANETTYVKAFLESENYVPPTPPSVIYENYPDPEQDGDISTADVYNFKEEFKNSALTELSGKTIRRSILRNDSLFVLALDAQKAPFVYIINPKTQEVLKTLDVTGTQGGIYALSDIAFTADGKLCACNMEETQFTPSGTFRVYKWDNYDGAPAEWFTSQKSGNYNNANTGNTLAITGDSKNCKVITTATTTGSSLATRVLIFNVEDGTQVSDLRNQDAAYSVGAWGEDFKFTVSPRDDENIIVDGSATIPVEYKLNKADIGAMTLVGTWNNADLTAKANGANYFKYAKHALMAAPVVDADGNNAGVKLFDITDGVDKARTIECEGAAVEAAAATYAMGGAMVNNADIDLYLVKGGETATISKFTTKAVEQPVVKGTFAYDLKGAKDASGYKIDFKATDETPSGRIVFTDAVTGEEVGEYPLGTIRKGDNTVTVADADIPFCNNKVNWSVELKGNAIPRITKLTDDSAPYQYIVGRGLAIDNSPESDYFGRFYVNSYKVGSAGGRDVAIGLYAYNIDWTPINTEAITGGVEFKGAYRMSVGTNGKIYVSEWTDGNSGVFIFDPANLNGNCINLFRDCTRASSGLFSNANGVQVGGSSTSAYIIGSGENTKLYTFDEDYTASGLGKGNNVLCYNLGTADKWSEAPSKVYAVAGKMLNTNCQVVADENGGVWVSQTRYKGNNAPGIPSFIYVNPEGTEVFNSGSELADEVDGSAGSAFAISPDGKTFVMNNGSGEFVFFDLTWNEGVPSLAYRYKYSHGIGEGTNYQVHQMAFDYAGNLYAVGKNLAIFAIPTDNNVATTPAKDIYAIDGQKVLAPTEPKGSINDDSTVAFTWTAPVTEAAITYNLYMDDALVGTAEGDAVSYTFPAPDPVDGTHTYGVSAVYPGGTESDKASVTLTFSSVEDNMGDSDKVVVYPNPTSGNININSPEEIVVVRVFSSTGALVGEFNESSIDLSNLASGTYFVKVNDRKPVIIIKK